MWSPVFDHVTVTTMMSSRALRVGTARVDITPRHLPAIVNGDFFERHLSIVDDPLSVRAVVLDDGMTRIAMAVVDSCLISAEMFELVKKSVAETTGLPTEHLMISATHCHSAPSVLAILGSGIDQHYADWLPGQIAESIVQANANLVDAAFGVAADADPENVFCRRFIMKPGMAWTENRAFTGSPGDIAQMNPEGKQSDIVCPTGRPDPTVNVFAVTKTDGTPLVVFGNYSTHYAGAEHLSADYFGVFAERIGTLLGAGSDFLGIMSNGTSGDTNCIDFRNPARTFDRFSVGESVARAAHRAYEKIEFSRAVTIDTMERTLEIGIRKPTSEQVALAERHLAGRDALKSIEDVYARETLLLHASPDTVRLKLQATRIGTLGIVAIPCEVFSATGREIRSASPFSHTFIVSHANGAFGYLPTADSFMLGGYTTWRARSSMLEETAERQIRLASLKMLDQLAERIV